MHILLGLRKKYGAWEVNTTFNPIYAFNYYCFGKTAVKKVEKQKSFLSRFFLVLLDFVSISYKQALWSSHWLYKLLASSTVTHFVYWLMSEHVWWLRKPSKRDCGQLWQIREMWVGRLSFYHRLCDLFMCLFLCFCWLKIIYWRPTVCLSQL